ncbi:TBCC domain-containing protein 1 [Lates japonicus]|uniref:TBCC domain-containing protein 1 n=1 Tax=Lates japonicus TaxID=270547 RepID=A0AAD3MKN0_LATJO|nr:TBCC domain-containing protein 1 [Lates japonicus]
MQHKARPRELRATDVTSRRQIGRAAGVSLHIRSLRLTVTNYIHNRARLYFHLCSSRPVDPPPIETELRVAGTRTKAENMEADTVSIWPRMEPFLLGALQVSPSSKLSLHYLRKMATYVRTRDGCFPALGWSMWRHIACGKLQLPEDLAWLYFETFDLLVGHKPEERLEQAECLSQCSSKSELDQQRNKLSVDTLQFLLFLYIQQLNRVSLRTSLIGEEWPSPRTRSPSPSDRDAKTSSQNKNWDDQAHLSFVQSHLAEILELLVEPGQLSQSGQALRDCQISLEAVRSLGLLLEGSVCGSKAVQPIHRLLAKGPLQTQAGYSTVSRSFPLNKLLSCLQHSLTLNPFGITACLRSGKKLAWAQQVSRIMAQAWGWLVPSAWDQHPASGDRGLVSLARIIQQTRLLRLLAQLSFTHWSCLSRWRATCEVPGGLPPPISGSCC